MISEDFIHTSGADFRETSERLQRDFRETSEEQAQKLQDSTFQKKSETYAGRDGDLQAGNAGRPIWPSRTAQHKYVPTSTSYERIDILSVKIMHADVLSSTTPAARRRAAGGTLTTAQRTKALIPIASCSARWLSREIAATRTFVSQNPLSSECPGALAFHPDLRELRN